MKLHLPFPSTRNLIRFALCLLILTWGSCTAFADTAKKSKPSATGTSTDTKEMKDAKEITAPKAEDPDKPQFHLGLPMWATSISGQVGIRNQVSDVAYIPLTSLVKHLDYIIPLSARMDYGKWGFLVEGQYTKLSETFSAPVGPFGKTQVAGSVQVQQGFADFNLSYKVLDTDRLTVAPFVGTRVEYVKVSGALGGNKPFVPSLNESGSQAWADPILGFETSYQVLKPVAVVAKADVGGFGAASDLTYELYLGGQTQVSRNFYVNLGYRYLSTDYSSGGFTYRSTFEGPQITCGVNF